MPAFARSLAMRTARFRRTLMFGSYLVELVIGLWFLFAVLGIVTSAISEAALSVMKVRAQHLKEWLAPLLSG